MHMPEWLPFACMVAPAQQPKISIMRIMEAVIIAGVSGAFTVSLLTVRLDERMTAFKDQQAIIIQQLRHDNEEMRRVLDKFNDQLIDHLTATADRQRKVMP